MINYELEMTKEGLYFCGYMEYHNFDHYPRYLTKTGWQRKNPYYAESPEELIKLAKNFPDKIPVSKREIFERKIYG